MEDFNSTLDTKDPDLFSSNNEFPIKNSFNPNSALSSYKVIKSTTLPNNSISNDTKLENHDDFNDYEFDFDLALENSDPFNFDDPFKSDNNSFPWKDDSNIEFKTNDIFTPSETPKSDSDTTKGVNQKSKNKEASIFLEKENGNFSPIPEFNDINPEHATRELRLHISRLAHRIQILESNIKSKDKKLSLFDSERNNWKNKALEFSTQSENNIRKIRALEYDLQNTKQQTEAELQKKIKEFELTNVEKMRNYEKYEQKFFKLKEEYDFLKTTLREAENLLLELENSPEKDIIKEMSNSLELRIEQIQTLSETLNEKDLIIDDLKNSLKSFERENSMLQGKLNNDFDYNAFNQELENELQEKLMRQKKAILADVDAKLEAQEQIIEKLNFELEKMGRRFNTLQNELQTKVEENFRYETEITFLTNMKNKLLQEMQDKSEEHSHNITSLNSELDTKFKELNDKELNLSKLEGLLTMKDEEIASSKRQVHDYDEHFFKLTRELNQLKFDLSMKEAQIQELETAVESKESDAKLQHLVSLEDTDKLLKQQQEEYKEIIRKYQLVIQDLEKSITKIKIDKETDSKKFNDLLDQLNKKDKKIKELKDTLQDLELEIFTKDQSHELNALKKAYQELSNMVGTNDVTTNDNITIQNHSLNNYTTYNEKKYFSSAKQNSNINSETRLPYISVKDDIIDEAVEKFITNSKTQLPTVIRIESGSYLIGGIQQTLKIIGSQLMVQTKDDMVPLNEFLSIFKGLQFSKNI